MVDRWRKLDLFALQICLIAFVIRVVDIDSSWGPGLYAMSTPLLFWRLLYYAQIFKLQGAMVQVGGPAPIQAKITHTCILTEPLLTQLLNTFCGGHPPT